VPQPSQTNIDPEFWERLRDTLKSHMKATGLKQKELAPKLGIDPTTLNNFLNRQSKTLGGLAVALACTVVDLICDGTRIGRSVQSVQVEPVPETYEGQLVLEFDGAFEFKRESEHPTIVLRKPPARHDSVRLVIRRIG
jgi:transcriptional regulator with XRE-family HTH domain